MGGKLKNAVSFLDPLGLFSGSGPKLESPKAVEVQQVQAPQAADGANAAAAAEERRRRQAAGGSQVLTSGSGASGQAVTAKKTLLG